MSSRLAERTAHILVIESFAPNWQLIKSVMGEQGFEKVDIVHNIHDAIELIRKESVDWVISPLFLDEEESAFSLLSFIIADQDFRYLNVSFFAGDEDEDVLLTAYEKGLFSHFTYPYNKQTLSEEIASLLTHMKRLNWDRTLSSAFNIREILKQKKLHEYLLRFEKKLLSYFPAHPEVLLQIAATQASLGAVEKVQQTISQVKMIDDSFVEKADILGQDLLEEMQEKSKSPISSGDVTHILGWDSCLIIDNDEASINFLQDVLGSFGVNRVEVCNDGVTAWQWLTQNDCPSLIIQEWKIPALTGPLLLQRIRYKYPTANILVVSSLVERKDKTLLEEMGVTAVLRKPLDEELLQKALIYIAQQEKIPTRAGSLEKKILNLLAEGNLSQAENWKAQYRQFKALPPERLNYIEAECAYAEGQYQKARDFIEDVLSKSPNSVKLLHLLGKVFMKLNDFASGLVCFKEAQKISPMNIHRLCTIAQVGSETGDQQIADQAMSEAESMDPEADSVQQTKVLMEIKQAEEGSLPSFLKDLEFLPYIIAYMNNRAVALVRNKQYEPGKTLYVKTIELIPKEDKPILAVLQYNCGLAEARRQELSKAYKHLIAAVSYGPSRVFTRSDSLLDRVKEAITHADELVLHEGISEQELSEQAVQASGENAVLLEEFSQKTSLKHKNILASIDVYPGEICCYRIFSSPISLDAKVKSSLKKIGL